MEIGDEIQGDALDRRPVDVGGTSIHSSRCGTFGLAASYLYFNASVNSQRKKNIPRPVSGAFPHSPRTL
jgi:hypothetical protein